MLSCLIIKIPHGQIAITTKQYVNFEWQLAKRTFVSKKGSFFSDLLYGAKVVLNDHTIIIIIIPTVDG